MCVCECLCNPVKYVEFAESIWELAVNINQLHALRALRGRRWQPRCWKKDSCTWRCASTPWLLKATSLLFCCSLWGCDRKDSGRVSSAMLSCFSERPGQNFAKLGMDQRLLLYPLFLDICVRMNMNEHPFASCLGAQGDPLVLTHTYITS